MKTITKPRASRSNTGTLETRFYRLSEVPDTTWFKCKIIKAHPGGLYDVHYDNGDNEEKVPGHKIRKHGEPKPVEKQTFKKGDKVEKQKNLRAARVLARVLKTWKPRIMSGWFMKVNRRGKQQKRWFHLLGTWCSSAKRENITLSQYISIKSLSNSVTRSFSNAIDHTLTNSEHRYETQLLRESSGHQTEEGTVESGDVGQCCESVKSCQECIETRCVRYDICDWKEHSSESRGEATCT